MLREWADSQRHIRVAIHWPRFGPYHLARLRAAHRHLQAVEIEVIGLETACRDNTYLWRTENGSGDFPRHVVFPQRSHADISMGVMWRRMTTQLNTLKPDAVAVNGYSLPDALAILAWCRWQRRPAILMSESKADDEPRQWWKEWVKRWLVRQYSASLCGGTPHQAYLVELGLRREQIFTGYDAVDNDYFRREATRVRQAPATVQHLPGLAPDDPFFLASARFIKRKNLDGLLLAYRRYREELAEHGSNTPWRLVILGDGEERPQLEAIIKISQLAGVTLAGFRQIEDLPAYYGRAGVFIHPALQEQWGLVVNEAMAAGLPVLVSNRCGCFEDLVVEGVNGFGFDPDNNQQLVDLMLRASSGSIDLAQMGQASLAHIQKFSPDAFARGLLQAVEYALKRT